LCRRLTIFVFLALFGAVVILNAWLSDDAYITFRTADNLVNGYGPTWNVSERVQSFTHPLWMFLVAGVYFLTREIFFSGLLLSLGISLAAVGLLLAQGTRTVWGVALAATSLTFSKAFVDYSTSGLENPLTHLILVGFLLIYLKSKPSPKALLMLSLLASLGMTNRMDTALLFAPALGFSLVRARSWRGFWAVTAGMLPFVLWELFSLFYYGSLFPNTAPAKLNIGLTSRGELVRQGGFYLLNSVRWDPLTLTVTTGLAWGLTVACRRWRQLPIVIGVLLYLLYLVWIGGDFMSGRFLAAPLLAAVVVVADQPWSVHRRAWLVTLVLVGGLGLLSPRSPVWTGGLGEGVADPASWVDPTRITDERMNYYQSAGLLPNLGNPSPPDHDWALEGRAAREAGLDVVQKGSVGFYGFFAGPDVHVVDLLALNDPLLARLPPSDQRSGLGHLGRMVPEGYIESIRAGENLLEDPNLARYYDKLSLVVRGGLFDRDRWVEIWRFNTGAYDHYRDAYAFFHGETLVQQLTVVNPTDRPFVYAYVWNNGAAEAFMLDDESRRGEEYSLEWSIAASRVRFQGPQVQQTSFGNPLSDAEPLNVGVFFSASPDLLEYDIYERRLWFRINDDGTLDVVLIPTEWHNGQAPGGAWMAEDIGSVLGPVRSR
jgi:arabinofuranosyltransferase